MYLEIVFFIFIILGLFLIVSTKNVIHALYGLIWVLIGTAALYVFLMAELLAVVQILLYAGGVVILLIVGIMVSNKSQKGIISGTHYAGLAGVISILLLGVLCFLFYNHPFSVPQGLDSENIFKEITLSFLTDHIIPFELIAFVLLVVLVGATYLAKKTRNG